jgi:hypothetical protein
MNSVSSGRPNGVVVPQSQLSTGKGAPRQLTGFSEAKSYGIEYTDDDGNKHVTIAQYISGSWYLPPNGENYAATLKPLNADTWLTKLLEERRASDGATVAGSLPKSDNVDVIGG